jgi:hypothetical protein
LQETTLSEDAYPLYCCHLNRQLVTKPGIGAVGNEWIAPYNPHMAQKYDAHINVEICSGIGAVKLVVDIYQHQKHVGTYLLSRFIHIHTQYADHQYICQTSSMSSFLMWITFLMFWKKEKTQSLHNSLHYFRVMSLLEHYCA